MNPKLTIKDFRHRLTKFDKLIGEEEICPIATDYNTNAKKKPTLKKIRLLTGWTVTRGCHVMNAGMLPIQKATKVIRNVYKMRKIISINKTQKIVIVYVSKRFN